jgi:hypothetical protein
VDDHRPRILLTVEVDPVSDPIEGVLRHRHGPDMPFAGWTALIRALELALGIEGEAGSGGVARPKAPTENHEGKL